MQNVRDEERDDAAEHRADRHFRYTGDDEGVKADGRGYQTDFGHPDEDHPEPNRVETQPDDGGVDDWNGQDQ